MIIFLMCFDFIQTLIFIYILNVAFFQFLRDILLELISLFGSDSASNFGTFISGVALIFGLILWKIQKRHEMKIKIANDALNFLDDFKMEIDSIIEVIYFVNSEKNKNNTEKCSVKGIPIGLKDYIDNYHNVIRNLVRTKNLCLRIHDNDLNEKIETLLKLMKPYIGLLQGLNFHDRSVRERSDKEIKNLPNKIEELYKQVHKILRDYISLYK